MANFSIEGRALAAGFKDIQRNWLWELTIALPTGLAPVPPDTAQTLQDRITVHCRSAIIPGRTTVMMESSFGGMKQWFPGKSEFAGTFTVNVEENDDMFVRQYIHKWQEYIFQTDIGTTATAGRSSKSAKRDLTASQLELQLFKYDGTKADKKIQFINGIIQGIGDATVSYEGTESIKYDLTFQYDYFNIIASN